MTEEEKIEIENLLKLIESQEPINADIEFNNTKDDIIDIMNEKGLAKIGKEMSVCKAD